MERWYKWHLYSVDDITARPSNFVTYFSLRCCRAEAIGAQRCAQKLAYISFDGMAAVSRDASDVAEGAFELL